MESAVPAFRVGNVARSMAWYRDVLGFAADPSAPRPTRALRSFAATGLS